MFKARAYLKDGRFEADLSLDRVREVLKDVENEVWVDIENISKDEVAFLRDDLNIHPIAIEEVLEPRERPEMQSFGQHILLVFHAPAPSLAKGGMDTVEMDFLVGNNFIVTVRRGPIASVKDMEDRINTDPRIMSRGCDFMLYFIADAMVDDYQPILNAIDRRIDSTQEAAATNPTSETFGDLMKLKADILEIRRERCRSSRCFAALIRGHTDIIETGLSVYFRSVCEHLQQINGYLDTFREEVNSAIQVSLAVKSDQLNEVMKVLTVIAVIVAPLTLITGVFGMNFDMPQWLVRTGMAITLALMVGLGVGLAVYFRKKRWL